MDKNEGNGLPRRHFIKLTVGTVSAVLGLSYVGVAGDFLNPPAADAAPLQEVGKVNEFDEGSPKFVTYKGNGIEEGVYVVNLGTEGWLALDFHCSHLQCAVNWVEAMHQFVCPCHGGVYDVKGNVLSGPPPKGLPKRQVQIQGDSVQVGGRIR